MKLRRETCLATCSRSEFFAPRLEKSGHQVMLPLLTALSAAVVVDVSRLAHVASTNTRRDFLHVLAAAAPALGAISAASAAQGTAVDLVVEVGALSTKARSLQFDLREAAPIEGSSYETVRKRIMRERSSTLQQLYVAMQTAAPDLRICQPGKEDCDCAPDSKLMALAALQVGVVQGALNKLDAALASGPRGFEALSTSGGGNIVYTGGEVELALETICEAADYYLDLASGRPLMTLRVAPI